MIQPDELRVGDLFDILNRNNPVHLPKGLTIKIITIGFSEVQWCHSYENPAMVPHDWHSARISDLSPIPLTEDWLLKFGFEYDGKYFKRPHNDYNYCFIYQDWAKAYAFYIEYTDSSDPNDSGVFYPVAFDVANVHQLQNLIHALTGSDLTLKE